MAGVIACAIAWLGCSGESNASAGTLSSSSSGGGGGGGGGNGAGGADPACAPAPGADSKVLRYECGVFVKPDGNDETGDGSEAHPFATLSYAITMAAKSGKYRVYACHGAYSEGITVPSRVSIYGGLDGCDSGNWTPHTTEKSTIQGMPGEIPLRLQGGSAAGLITIDGFAVTAAPATIPGTSSIAAIAEDKAIVNLTRCDLTAGSGAPGVAGESAPKEAPPTMMPGDANKGRDACTDDTVNYGGQPLTNDCGNGETSTGGPGGDGMKDTATNGTNGAPSKASMPNAGKGGAVGIACGSGADGAPGENGPAGAAGTGAGKLSAESGWIGASGGNGAKGAIGQGGGGGAGRAGSLSCAGAGGGAGGAGGCGGLGGKGGLAGGSSIALVSIDAVITLNQVTLTTGDGGIGGVGGDGQFGGHGSNGSLGGKSGLGTPSGCPGGYGGNGGVGGGGGGGAGGHSLGIAFRGTAPTGEFTAKVAEAGAAGGIGGFDGVQNNNGEQGKAQTSLEVPDL